MIKVTRLHHTPRKHGRGWEGAAPASDTVARTSVPRQSFFFWICADSARFVPTRLDLHRIDFDSRRTELIWPESGRIGHIGSYRPATDMANTAKTGRKRPKLALKLAGTTEILTSNVFFAFFFLCFVDQGMVMCFLRIF